MTEEKQHHQYMETNTEQNTPGTSAEISASTQSIRLPTFWTNNPKIWFITAEVQFAVNRITRDEVKHSQIVSALSPEACETVLDLLENPPIANRYETLKAALIERHSPSDERRLETLLDKTEIGDRRPSEVLRQIKILAGNNFTPTIIKSLWVRKMPEYIRIALVPLQETSTTEDLSKMADKLSEAISNSNHIGAIQRPSRSSQRSQSQRSDHNEYRSSSNNSTNLEIRLARVEAMLAKINTGMNRGRSRSRGRRFQSQLRGRSNLTNRQRQRQHDICWYHNMFGTQAQKCTKPCNFQPGIKAMEIDQPPNL